MIDPSIAVPILGIWPFQAIVALIWNDDFSQISLWFATLGSTDERDISVFAPALIVLFAVELQPTRVAASLNSARADHIHCQLLNGKQTEY